MSYRDFTDESAGAVLVFDRARLEERFQLRAYHDPRCDDEDLYGPNYVEAEEVVRRRHIKDLSRYLLAVIWLKPRGLWRPAEAQEDALAQEERGVIVGVGM